jgi:tetratricopeptide (TPR) repeat protein
MQVSLRRTPLTIAGFSLLLAITFSLPGLSQDLTNPQAPSASQTPPSDQGTQNSTPRAITLEERADIFMARKSYDEAADYYYRALKQTNFGNSTLWNKLGIAYQSQLDYKKARKAYKKAIHLHKEFAEAWNNMGTTYFMQKNAKKSLKYYQNAIEYNPNNAAFHLNLGTSLYQMKKYGEAVDQYRAALMIDPDVLFRKSSVGTVMQTRGTDIQFYFYLAKVFASLGRADEAVRYLRRAFEDGFNDQKKIEEDPDFKKISKYPAFVELMKNPPVPLK